MKQSVFVTRTIPESGLRLLRKDKRLAVEVYEKDQQIPRKELLKRVKGKDVILSILTERIDKEVMDAAGPSLKMIANYAVGFDNIDLIEAEKRHIVVTNAPHPRISESVAEHTIALMFALAHRVVESDKFTRAGKYKAWSPNLLLGTDLAGKTIGIIGTGAIGSAVVRRLHTGFEMKVLYTNPHKKEDLERETGAKRVDQDTLLKKSDFVSLHVPLLKETRHLISTKELKMMKKSAFIINTSRGPIIEEKALLNALSKGWIKGAALDVYECEPMIDCDPEDTLELRLLPNVVLTPHTASATVETREAMSTVAAENILAFLDGHKPPNAI